MTAPLLSVKGLSTEFRTERGPRPGSRPSNWISRSISGPFI